MPSFRCLPLLDQISPAFGLACREKVPLYKIVLSVTTAGTALHVRVRRRGRGGTGRLFRAGSVRGDPLHDGDARVKTAALEVGRRQHSGVEDRLVNHPHAQQQDETDHAEKAEKGHQNGQAAP